MRSSPRPLALVLALVAALLGAAAGPACAAGEKSRAPRKVVLDPGHGGEEDGAIGPAGLKEKEVTLDTARRLAALLRADGFEVVLTRDGDDTVKLDPRAEVANTQHADLFVSIHANASPSSKAHGAETYVLSREAVDDAARTVAALENGAARPDPAAAAPDDKDLPFILWDLAQAKYLERSARLAGSIQDRLNAALGLTNRGVRQAPFRVLVGATCPAVLVELGFISNPAEETQLNDPQYRRKLAEALAAAIRQFRDQDMAAGGGR